MERLTAELFNTYVQRSGDAEPYYTEYCDGRTVTCPGMKQWGTVERAKEGKNALQILRYYYGKRVQLVTTDNIASIPSSYPGSPLRRGSSGTNVRILQKQLSRIAKDYPSFGKPVVNGVFDEATERSVKRFQKQFSLTADGVEATITLCPDCYPGYKAVAEANDKARPPRARRPPAVGRAQSCDAGRAAAPWSRCSSGCPTLHSLIPRCRASRWTAATGQRPSALCRRSRRSRA